MDMLGGHEVGRGGRDEWGFVSPASIEG